ncbi:MAG: type III pantothenate kinase [Bacteroidales bacterium]
MGRNLIIDIGNSVVKLAIFDNSEIEDFQKCAYGDLPEKLKTANFLCVDACIISSTKNTDNILLEYLHNNKVSCVRFLPTVTPVPIKNQYKSKDTLGADRLANAVAANFLFPNNNTLVIDCGTAITFDYVSAEAEYLGGTISPGLNMRFKALNYYTDKLPLVELDNTFSTDLMGNNTRNSILNGVVNGVIGEITSTINIANSTFDTLKVIMTGGDSLFLEKRINSGIFVSQYLTLVGLNSILKYNASYN